MVNPPPWRIAFDATHLSRLNAGVSTFILNLLEALDAISAHEWSLSVLANASQVDLVRSHVRSAAVIPVSLPSTAYRIVWEQLGLPRLLDRLGIHLLHSPHYSLPLTAHVIRVVTVHDLSYILMPERHRRTRRWFFRRMIPRAARVADHVFCVSDQTRHDLLQLYPDIPADKTSVVPLAVNPSWARSADDSALVRVRARYGLTGRFVLHVGTIEPRKNIGTAIDAVATLRAVHPDVELVLVGQQGWESRTLFERIERAAGVRYLGHVPTEDLPAIYRAATAVVMPSHYEGFGLPVLEAMALGTPVVCSGKGSLAEVAGNAALVPADDTPAAYAQSLETAISDHRTRERLYAAGLARAAQFSWATAAATTAATYERLLAASISQKIGPGAMPGLRPMGARTGGARSSTSRI